MDQLQMAIRRQEKLRQRAEEVGKQQSLERAMRFATALAKKYPQPNYKLPAGELIKKKPSTRQRFTEIENFTGDVEPNFHTVHVDQSAVQRIESVTMELEAYSTRGYYRASI